jgi:hypothetical protein
MRLCDCCGRPIDGMRRQARYCSDSCRKRAFRSTRSRPETVAPIPGSGKPAHAADSVQIHPQTSREEMLARLDALAEEFDRAGSTSAMRREGRALAKALGLPRPRWLPIDDWGSS